MTRDRASRNVLRHERSREANCIVGQPKVKANRAKNINRQGNCIPPNTSAFPMIGRTGNAVPSRLSAWPARSSSGGSWARRPSVPPRELGLVRGGVDGIRRAVGAGDDHHARRGPHDQPGGGIGLAESVGTWWSGGGRGAIDVTRGGEHGRGSASWCRQLAAGHERDPEGGRQRRCRGDAGRRAPGPGESGGARQPWRRA